ncbi:MAG TPA: hypothetical protein VID48_09665, partial [Solirubrobacteraceae bacterium]
DKGKASAKESGSTVTVETGETVTCPPGSENCTATVSASTTEEKAKASAAAHKRKHSKPKPVVIGHATITVPAGHASKLTFKLNSKGSALLRKHHRLKILLTVVITLPGKTPVEHTRTITITQPKPRHKS